MPVLIVGSYESEGNADAMNAAWGGIYDGNQVILCLSEGHKTTKNIKARGAFTVSFADAAHVAACDYVGLASANNIPDKMVKAGFHTVKSEFVDAPIICELPMTAECKLVKQKRIEPNVPKKLVFPHIAALFVLLYDSIASPKKHHTARKNKLFRCEAVFE